MIVPLIPFALFYPTTPKNATVFCFGGRATTTTTTQKDQHLNRDESTITLQHRPSFIKRRCENVVNVWRLGLINRIALIRGGHHHYYSSVIIGIDVDGFVASKHRVIECALLVFSTVSLYWIRIFFMFPRRKRRASFVFHFLTLCFTPHGWLWTADCVRRACSVRVLLDFIFLLFLNFFPSFYNLVSWACSKSQRI